MVHDNLPVPMKDLLMWHHDQFPTDPRNDVAIVESYLNLLWRGQIVEWDVEGNSRRLTIEFEGVPQEDLHDIAVDLVRLYNFQFN